MSTIELNAEQRAGTGKELAKKYRKEKKIPAIIYGQGTNTNILVDEREFMKLYPSLTKSTLINLSLGKEKHEVLIKDYDKNYIKGNFIHIDFYELQKGKLAHTKIKVELIGIPVGVREGGILEKHITELNIECLPKDIVAHFDIDVSEMKIGDTMHVKDMNLDKKYKVITSAEEVIAHVSGKMKDEPTKTEVEETVAPAAKTAATTA